MMENTRKNRKLIILTAMVGLALAFGGCEEIDIPILVDAEEIARYINESDDAQALFRTSSIIIDDPFTVALDPGAVYSDHLDSTRRSIEVVITVDELEENFIAFYKRLGIDTNAVYIQDFGSPYGRTKDAEVEVLDRFYVTTRRIIDGDTTYFESIRKLTRYAYFLKLGDDSQSFAGWLLRAWSGGGPVLPARLDIVREDASIFSGDSLVYRRISSELVDLAYGRDTVIDAIASAQPYIWLSPPDAIARVDDGESLAIRSTLISDLSHLMTVCAQTSGGYSLQSMQPQGDFAYTATINTPTNHRPSWNIIFFQEFRRLPGDPVGYVPINILDYKSWCVPYRVE